MESSALSVIPTAAATSNPHGPVKNAIAALNTPAAFAAIGNFVVNPVSAAPSPLAPIADASIPAAAASFALSAICNTCAACNNLNVLSSNSIGPTTWNTAPANPNNCLITGRFSIASSAPTTSPIAPNNRMNAFSNPACEIVANNFATLLSTSTKTCPDSTWPHASMMLNNAGNSCSRNDSIMSARPCMLTCLPSPANRSSNSNAVCDITGRNSSKNFFNEFCVVIERMVVAHLVLTSVNRRMNQSVVSPAAMNVDLITDPRFLMMSMNCVNRVCAVVNDPLPRWSAQSVNCWEYFLNSPPSHSVNGRAARAIFRNASTVFSSASPKLSTTGIPAFDSFLNDSTHTGLDSIPMALLTKRPAALAPSTSRPLTTGTSFLI